MQLKQLLSILCLSFLTCRVGMLAGPASVCSYVIKWVNLCKESGIVNSRLYKSTPVQAIGDGKL